MRRREFIAGLASAAAWPIASHGQQSTIPTVGFLNLASADQSADRVAAFREGLREAGFVEGRNVTVEFRWADGRYDRLPEFATELMSRQVALIVATSGAAVRAVKAATATIPIVFYVGDDPIALGLVASLNRPGGNVTGIYNWSQQVGPKRLELLRELLPTATVIGQLINPANSAVNDRRGNAIRAAARQLGLQVHDLPASDERGLIDAFENLKRMQAGGLLIAGDLFFAGKSEQLAALATSHGVPAVSEYRQFADAGGLASYGVSFTDSYRQVGTYAGRILKGEKPSDLPVQQSTKVGLTLNLKSAKALGITVPLPLLGRADEVIE
jgi:putative ABC transport system substrate-binding protein